MFLLRKGNIRSAKYFASPLLAFRVPELNAIGYSFSSTTIPEAPTMRLEKRKKMARQYIISRWSEEFNDFDGWIKFCFNSFLHHRLWWPILSPVFTTASLMQWPHLVSGAVWWSSFSAPLPSYCSVMGTQESPKSPWVGVWCFSNLHKDCDCDHIF